MFVLLLALLVVALSITVVGWMLSPRNQVSQSRGMSYAVRGHETMRTARRPRVGANRRIQPRYAQVEIDNRAWNGILASLNIGQLFKRRKAHQTPWLGLTLVLITLFLFGVYSLRTLLPNSALVMATSWVDANNGTTSTSATTKSNAPTQLFPGMVGASKALNRIYQLDPAQYSNQKDFDTWAYSTCSAASMTEVINSYGHNYRIADILKVEAGIGEITPDLGLIEPTGIDKTVAHFGFKTTWLVKPTLDDAIRVANTGRPLIINFPPQLWAGGHLLVMLGGDKDHVYVADSSRLNMRVFTRQNFLKYWIGFAVVVEPNNA